MGLIRHPNEPDDPRDMGPSGNSGAERARLIHYADQLEDQVDALREQLRGAVDAARADMARHLRNMAKDPSWKREVQVAFEYAAGTFHDYGGQ